MISENESHKYDDIINLPNPTSTKYPRMSMHNRAAQFAPFQSLTGYGAIISEEGRLTDKRVIIDESKKVELDQMLMFVIESKEEIMINITYFMPDEKKDGGKYVSKEGIIKKVDSYKRCIVFYSRDLEEIPIDDIYSIDLL